MVYHLTKNKIKENRIQLSDADRNKKDGQFLYNDNKKQDSFQQSWKICVMIGAIYGALKKFKF